jgi:hypothetical protein
MVPDEVRFKWLSLDVVEAAMSLGLKAGMAAQRA